MSAGFAAPSSRVARPAASAAALAASRSENVRPAEKPYPVWVSPSSPATALAEQLLIVRRVLASTPSEFAIAASTAVSE